MPKVAKRRQQRLGHALQQVEGRRVRRPDLDRHRPRRVAPRPAPPRSSARVRTRLGASPGGPSVGAAAVPSSCSTPVTRSNDAPGAAQAVQLLRDGRLVGRQVRREAGGLPPHDGAEAEDHAEAEHHHQQHRRDPRHVQPPERTHQRRQHEGQQHRQHDRDEHLAREVEDRHHDRRDLEHLQAGAGHGGGKAAASRWTGEGAWAGVPIGSKADERPAARGATPAPPIRCEPAAQRRSTAGGPAAGGAGAQLRVVMAAATFPSRRALLCLQGRGGLSSECGGYIHALGTAIACAPFPRSRGISAPAPWC